MAKSPTFHLNYYVGAVLAQGGDMWLEDTKIVFSPSSAIDRAMGATDVEIPFQQIKGAEYKGDMRKWFHIETADKTHRFQGSNAKNAWDCLKTVLQRNVSSPAQGPALVPSSLSPKSGSIPAASPGVVINGMRVSPATIDIVCQHCVARVEPGFSFCPSCGSRLQGTCPSCQKVLKAEWMNCAFCGRKAA